MRRFVAVIVASLVLAYSSTPLAAKGHGSGHGRSRSSDTKSSTGTKHKSTKPSETTPSRAAAARRDSHGRTKRSEAAKAEFMRQTGYPHGRAGYVIDHIKPLACGGADAPSNMQWQTIAEARAKDTTERIGCR
jgi:hypothetical protein